MLNRKKAKIAWVIISVFGVVSMVAYLLLPLIYLR